MSRARPTVLKIGGSVITDKGEEMKARTQVIDRLSTEIQKANIGNLIIVHGGGSFGHPLAKRFMINDGFIEDSQRIGFCETHHMMTVLNGLVMDSLVWHSVPAVSITTSSVIVTKSGRIHSFGETPIKRLLEIKLLPVMYGDAVLDIEQGFAILSGDQLVSTLATEFEAERVIIGADVDGLYDADPKIDRNAKMLPHLTVGELAEMQSRFGESTGTDVTGGMLGKSRELAPTLQKGIPVMIVNATKPNLVCRALRGEKVRGTLIEKE